MRSFLLATPLASLALSMLAGCSCGTTHMLDDAGVGDAAARPDAAPILGDAAQSDAAPSDAFVTPPTDLRACGALGDGEIAAAAVSADGSLYAMAGFDTVRLVDARTGLLLRTLGEGTGRSGSASAIAFDEDGSRLWVGTSDGIRELATDDGRSLRDIRVARGCCGVSHVAIAPAAGVALAYSEGFRVIDLTTGTVRDLALTGALIDDFDVSPDGALGAFVAPAGVLLVSLVDGSTVRTIPLRGAHAARFSPDGSRIAVAIRDASTPDVALVVAVVRTDGTGAPSSRVLPVSLSFPLAWSTDGLVHVGLDDGTVLALAAPDEGSELAPVGPSRRLPIADPYTLSVSADGSVLATRQHAAAVAADGSLRWLRAGSTSRVPMHEMAFDARGNLLADGVLWDLATGLAVRALDPALGRAALDADGRALAWIEEGFVTVEIDGELAARFRATVDPEGTDEAEAIAIDARSVILASRSRVAVVGRDTGLPFSSDPITARSQIVTLERSPDGLHLLVGTLEDPPQVISLLGGRDDTPEGLTSGVVRSPDAVRFLPDGRIAAALFPTRNLALHSLDGTRTEVPEVPLVRGTALSSDGELVALRLDGVSLHDAASFGELMFLGETGAAPQLNAVAISPDSTRVAWTSRERIEIACIARE